MTLTPPPPEVILLPEEIQFESDLQTVLQSALDEHRRGAFDEAEALYRIVLDARPQHADVNYNLGLMAIQRGRHEDALPYLETALGANPNELQYWASYIDALRRAGQTDAAWLMLEMAQKRGLHGPAVDTLIYQMSRPAQSTQDAPSTGEPAPQPEFTKEAVAARPDFDPRKRAKAPSQRQVDELNRIYDSGRIDDALVLAQSFTQRFPDDPVGWRAVGIALHAKGRYDDAIPPLRRALGLSRDDSLVATTLADILRMKGALDEAERLCSRAIELTPEYADAHRILGMTLLARGRAADAETHCRRAAELAPRIGEMHNTLGVVLSDQGRTLDAEACFRHALDCQPNNACAFHNLLFSLTHNPEIDGKTLFEQHRRFGEQWGTPLRPHWPRHDSPRDPQRPLKVGFVSADLFHHAVATLFEPVLAELAREERLILHVYYNFTIEDATTQRMRSHVAHWHSVWGMTDEALAEKIRADGIDILIDLSGHTARNRLMTFARKPAPVQASWIGYPGTTGLAAMDYYLADRHLVPRGEIEAQFTEKVVHLPAIAPFRLTESAPPVNLLPAFRNGHVTFGSFNRLNKMHPEVIALWSELLKAVPNARMLIAGMPEDGSDGGVGAWFAAEGIAPDRLDFRPRAPLAAYLQQHHHVDICLDTFPYAGGTTTLHAMWMGVPTITLPGATAASRGGVMGQPHAGLDAFVARDRDDFVRIGVDWSNNLLALADVRSTLRQRSAASPMFRPEIVAAGLSAALRTMWRRWCAGAPPAPFDAMPTSDEHDASVAPGVAQPA
ncbi:glycosyltransferase [Burkholderia sp. Bp9143]|uniref:tetratricopeptide repeat protein n=1 Tax=Burkholderia sp. Bp9143 TaxID=2184574 RepID=UPI000F5AF517|nr:tetratricopeptide repeat protein [Burkholderia sp. Bp9143]RQR26937.1 glycosyltransferase [Burkholderia sp. Bp9143]